MEAPTFTRILAAFVILCLLEITTLTGGDIIDENEVVEEADEFDVYPGGEVHTFEQEKEGVRCKFTYSAQGGTNEKWLFVISHTPDKKRFHCTVERPDGNSYLFFMTFSLSVEGATLEEANVAGKNFEALGKEQYIINGNEVKHSSTFQSGLSSVLITAKGVISEEL
ncbi:PREDICTED: myeloid-derived growth factor-like [Priapulus caudatus]|uniref:Myeloid-derived growth factor-like n=1 Tax=Priapulus caudatus TaxID=37621 RepID=A0ABM1DRL3_PRICU|nr:PREDICTED: myeloid-derived growth factor-like [Priapulus caudatus]